MLNEYFELVRRVSVLLQGVKNEELSVQQKIGDLFRFYQSWWVSPTVIRCGSIVSKDHESFLNNNGWYKVPVTLSTDKIPTGDQWEWR